VTPIVLALALACGSERQAAKVLTDACAGRSDCVDVAQIATVEQLAAMPNTAWIKWSNSLPRQASEMVIYRVTAAVTGWKLETDLDWHVVIRGDSGQTMVVELPDPSCAPDPTTAAKFSAARVALVAASGAARGPRKGKLQAFGEPPSVTFVGLLFFDKIHGQDGVAPNGVELHPATVVQAP
jgi:hypothetical protein